MDKYYILINYDNQLCLEETDNFHQAMQILIDNSNLPNDEKKFAEIIKGKIICAS